MNKNFILRGFINKIKLNDKKKVFEHLYKINSTGLPLFFESFKKNYSYSYGKKIVSKYKNIKTINIIGMGGSSAQKQYIAS